MATKVMSLRLPDDLREWVIAYAGERGVSQAVVISAAVREFREAAKAGVPELEEPSAGASGGVAPRRGPSSAEPTAPRAPVRKAVLAPFDLNPPEDPAVLAAQREHTAALQARQEKLNRAKYGRS